MKNSLVRSRDPLPVLTSHFVRVRCAVPLNGEGECRAFMNKLISCGALELQLKSAEEERGRHSHSVSRMSQVRLLSGPAGQDNLLTLVAGFQAWIETSRKAHNRKSINHLCVC